LQVYPNPAKDIVVVPNMRSGDNIAVYNTVGQRMVVAPTTTGIKTTHLLTGVYTVRLRRGNMLFSKLISIDH
jgi:hypothetical protein